MTLADDVLRFEVTDDGRGGADPFAGSGILGLRDRAEAVGGTLFVISPPGKGTMVTAQLPLSALDRDALARAKDVLRVVALLDGDQAVEVRPVVRATPVPEIGSM